MLDKYFKLTILLSMIALMFMLLLIKHDTYTLAKSLKVTDKSIADVNQSLDLINKMTIQETKLQIINTKQ